MMNFFSIEKITTEKYQIDSKIDKVTIDKQMMLDVVHHLVKTIKTSKFLFNVIDYSYGMIYDLSKYGDFEYDVCNYNYEESTKCLIDILSNATIGDIDESFVYNQCDLKGCHNYFIRFSNVAYRESEKLFKCYNGETYEERCKIWDEAKEYKRKNKAISFGIQFRTQGNGDIVFCGPYDYCYGRKTRCVSTKKMPFGETEKINLLNL